MALAALAAVYASSLANSQPECVRPQGGYLIIASSRGFNDSVDHLNAAPTAPWPILSVHRGDTVSIVVCNTDTSAHGFQIDHYYANGIVSVAPGKSITVTFVASESGTFRVYCQIPCPIHIFMQDGELVVV